MNHTLGWYYATRSTKKKKNIETLEKITRLMDYKVNNF